jgi:hypothetical protein
MEPLPNVTPVTATVTSPQVGPSIFQEAPRVSVGSGLEALAQGVDAIAVQAATAKGQQDGAQPIQRDADGNAQPVARDNFIFGDAGRAYSHAVDVGMLAGVQTNINERVAELRTKFQQDPDGFKVAVGSFADGLKANYPGALGAAAFSHATQVASEHFIGLVDQNRTADIAKNLQATQTRIADLGTDIENISRGTISPTTAFLDDPTTPAGAKIAQRNLFLQQLASNPDWSKTFSPEAIDSQIRMDRQRYVNAWALGNSTAQRDANGIDAAIDWARKNVLNSDSNMPFREREAAFNGVVSRIQTLTTAQQAKAAASQQQVDTFIKAFDAGVYPGDVAYQNALRQANESFDAAGVGRLQAAHDVYFHRLSPVAGLPPAAGISATMGPPQPQDAAAQGKAFFVSRGWTPEQASGIMGNLTHESGGKLDPNARAKGDGSDGSDSIGIGQWNQERATALQQFAASKGKPWNDYQTQLEFVDHELNGSEALAGGMIRNAKDVQGATGAMLGYERPKGWSAGGNPEAALGWQSRLGYANAVMSGPQVTGANSPVPFTQAQLDANPFLGAASVRATLQDKPLQVAYAKQQMQIMEGAISLGTPPAPEQLAKVQQIAMANPQELGEAFTKLQAHVAANPIAMMAAGQPDSGAAYLAQVDNMARTSPDLFHIEYAQSLHAQVAGRAKQLAEAPHDYAARNDVAWSPPVTPMAALADPQSIGADSPQQVLQSIVATRRDSAFQISQRTQQPAAGLLFQKGDIDQLTNALQKSDGPAADMLLRSLSGSLNPNEMAALASNKDFSNAVAGLTRSGDPAKAGPAFSFLDKQWRENPEAFKKEYGGEMETRMQVFQDKIAWMPPDQAMKEMQRANDPGTARTIAANREEADKFLKDVTSNQVLKQLGPGWMNGWIPFSGAGAPVSNDANASASAMLADYRSNVRDLYGESGDRGQAEAAALVRMQQKWGVSEINGGRITAYPPEAHYPPDAAGKRDYITQQLNQDVSDAAHAHGLDLGTQPHALVSDQGTQEDIASRKPPSYKVVVADKDGHWNLLEQSPGVAMRFRADAADILPGGAADKARMLRRAQSEANMGMGPQ